MYEPCHEKKKWGELVGLKIHFEMPRGVAARRKRRGKGKKRTRSRRKGGGASKQCSADTTSAADTVNGLLVSRVLDNVMLADAIMSYCFVLEKGGITRIPPLALTNSYWYSCHEDFVARNPQALLRCWFEACCNSRGLFEHNRTETAERLHGKLKEIRLGETETLFLQGTTAKCFQGSADGNVHVMSLLKILSTASLQTNTMVVSFARHLMSQWMYLSIGDWRAEMRDKEGFKKNLMEMCVGWEKARREGCRPARAALERARMLFKLAVAFEERNAPKAQRIIDKLNN